jgi:hypothetical protein
MDEFKVSFFHSHESKGWRLPVVPTIGSFTLSSTNCPAGGRLTLPARLTEAILVSVEDTQELALGYPAPEQLSTGQPVPGTQSVLDLTGEHSIQTGGVECGLFSKFRGLLTRVQPGLLEIISTAGLRNLPPTLKRLSVHYVRWVGGQLVKSHQRQVVEDFVQVQAGLRESLTLQLSTIPASGRLFRERDLAQLRNLELQNVMVWPHPTTLEVCDRPHLIPGFDDFMIALSSAMVTTMPRLGTLLISFKQLHGPIAYNGPYYVKYDRPSVLRMWRTLNDDHREGIYGLVGRDLQGSDGWIVPQKVLENWGCLLQKMRKRAET